MSMPRLPDGTVNRKCPHPQYRIHRSPVPKTSHLPWAVTKPSGTMTSWFRTWDEARLYALACLGILPDIKDFPIRAS